MAIYCNTLIDLEEQTMTIISGQFVLTLKVFGLNVLIIFQNFFFNFLS